MKVNVSFEARDNTIKDILFSTYSFQIPRYQRPYAWDTDQISSGFEILSIISLIAVCVLFQRRRKQLSEK